jgi:hypothetical protein
MSDRREVLSVFSDVARLVGALRRLQDAGHRDLRVYSPVGLPELEHLLPRRGSPVRFVTLAMGAAGAVLGFWLCIGSALLYGLIVGAKPPVSILPYCIVSFELTVLVGGLSTLAAVILFARLTPVAPRMPYDGRFGEDRFGISVSCPLEQVSAVSDLLRSEGAEEVNEGSGSVDG